MTERIWNAAINWTNWSNFLSFFLSFFWSCELLLIGDWYYGIHGNRGYDYQWKLYMYSSWVKEYTGAFRSSWWCHQVETFSALLAFCEGNSPVAGEFPSQTSVTLLSFMFSSICACTNSSTNNGDVGVLRRHRAHYDVTNVLKENILQTTFSWFDLIGMIVALGHTNYFKQGSMVRKLLYGLIFIKSKWPPTQLNWHNIWSMTARIAIFWCFLF